MRIGITGAQSVGKTTLLNAGISKDLINQAIKEYNLKTDLIPEHRLLIKSILREGYL